MLKFKNVLTLLVLALLFAFVSNTFAKDLPGDKAGRLADNLYKKLSLTNDQYTKVYQILFAHITKDSGMPMSDKKEGKKTKKNDDKLKSIRKSLRFLQKTRSRNSNR